jgi:hypothetical protein
MQMRDSQITMLQFFTALPEFRWRLAREFQKIPAELG